jgi:FixJ family two-component response regulator
MHILFVDDKLEGDLKNIFERTKQILKDEYSIVTVSTALSKSGALGEIYANNNTIGNDLDLAVIDQKMGESDTAGEELVQIISKEFPHVAIAMLTGHGDIDLAIRLLRLGICDYIGKENFKTNAQIKETFERIFSSPSFLTKQKLKKHANQNWQSYISSLRSKEIGWYAYTKARLLLVEKLLHFDELLGVDEMNYLLPIMQCFCVDFIQEKIPDFIFTRLEKTSRANSSNAEEAKEWLKLVHEFYDLPLSDPQEKALRAGKKKTGAKKNTFTNFLYNLRFDEGMHEPRDKNAYERALLCLNVDKEGENLFNKVRKFDEIRRIQNQIRAKTTYLQEESLSELMRFGRTNQVLEIINKRFQNDVETANLTTLLLAQWNTNEEYWRNGDKTEENRGVESHRITKATLELMTDLKIT